MKDVKRWRGLCALVGAAVDQGACAIERVHLETARRPFAILEQIPGVAEPALGIHQVHDTVVSGVYDAVRLVNRVVGTTLDTALDALDTEASVQSQAASESESAASGDSADTER